MNIPLETEGKKKIGFGKKRDKRIKSWERGNGERERKVAVAKIERQELLEEKSFGKDRSVRKGWRLVFGWEGRSCKKYKFYT